MNRGINKKLQDEYVNNKEKSHTEKMKIGKGKRFFTYTSTFGMTVVARCPYCNVVTGLSREQSGQYMRLYFNMMRSVDTATKTICNFCNKEVYGFHS
jgi:hypothetical protein